ncbi:MAG: hypothetical protein QM820_60825 [Minicystis sp.]
MTSTGCLISDPPQFRPAKHTRPFLVEATADPDPRAVLAVDSTLLGSSQSTITFSANVISQDDPVDSTSGSAFQQVKAWLYLDYGLAQDPLLPYAFVIPPANELSPGATLDDKSRRVSATWRPALQPVEPGCHTVTLVVSHKFDDLQCPVCDDDFSTITWQILRCNRSLGDDDCNKLPVAGTGSCEKLTNSCATVRAKLEAADAGLAACPEDETADGGAQ